MQGAQVCILVRELRFHMPQGAAKPGKKKKKKKSPSLKKRERKRESACAGTKKMPCWKNHPNSCEGVEIRGGWDSWEAKELHSKWDPGVEEFNSNIVSVQFSHSVMSDSLRPHESQHARPHCPSPTPGVYPNPCPSSQWCHLAISSSVVPFSSCPPSLPAPGSFPMSQLFTWGGQSTGISALASFLPKKAQGWSPSEWTGWISLQSKGLSRVFSNTTVQKHQFFGAQLSL